MSARRLPRARRAPGALLLVAGAALAAPGATLAAAPAEEPLTLGLFLPQRGPAAALGREAAGGAEIAVARANLEGGIGGRSIRLASAPSDLPWEGASGALVRLIYEEGAVAVIGGLDARSAHLAEQIVTRARGRAVFVTPWASDATLTRIRIPWFFSVVPDDRLQARVLARAVSSARGLRRAVAWLDGTADGRAALQDLLAATPRGAVAPFEAPSAGSRDVLAAAIGRGEVGALVLLASPHGAAELAGWLRRQGHLVPLVAPLALAVPGFYGGPDGTAEGAILVAPAVEGSQALDAFREEFEARYGAAPGALALYSHDAVVALVAALRRAASPPGRRLEEALASIVVQGLTGEIRFDERRGRGAAPGLAVVRRGRLLPAAPAEAGPVTGEKERP